VRWGSRISERREGELGFGFSVDRRWRRRKRNKRERGSPTEREGRGWERKII
jgi:hypothetical protein